MKVYFITSNHNDLKHVKEFFSYYIDNFEEFEYAFSENIVINSCNIILEEFSNNKFKLRGSGGSGGSETPGSGGLDRFRGSV